MKNMSKLTANLPQELMTQIKKADNESTYEKHDN